MASAGLLHPQIDVNLEEVEDSITEGQYRPNVNNPLLARKRISDVWPAQPPDDHLHVFVSLPSGMGSPTLAYDGGECFIRLFALAQGWSRSFHHTHCSSYISCHLLSIHSRYLLRPIA